MSEESKVAETYEEYRASGHKMKTPPPRACTFCGHIYVFPCDGRDSCLNKDWMNELRKKANG